jgi:hypothetical protein
MISVLVLKIILNLLNIIKTAVCKSIRTIKIPETIFYVVCAEDKEKFNGLSIKLIHD